MGNDFHTINYLLALHDRFGSYPNGVIRISEHIPGTAFFPGGYGLWNTQPDEPLPPMPVGGVMIVGHNFDSEAGFERAFNHSGENLKGPTWRNLLAFLKQVEIFPEWCFFTNAYVGLQSGDRAIGPFPGERDHEFVCWCQSFLLEQIKLMQPRLILSLGAYVPLFLAPLSIDSRPALIAEKYAESQGKGNVFHTALMQAYWQQGCSIDDKDVLKEIAEQVALNTEHFDDVLANPAFDAEVTANIDLAQDYGLTAVPALVSADRYLVLGAQPYEVLKQVVEKVLEEG